MNFELKGYKTLVFDCDGVVLNSNKIKTKAFYQAALPYGESAAQSLVAFHLERGGISRYEKFKWFMDSFAENKTGPNLDQLLEVYAKNVIDGLLTCEVAHGLAGLREKTKQANWLIVSGGDQNELRHVFNLRGISKYFDGGIFGSPDDKNKIVEREILQQNIKYNALFLGDSEYDFVVAKKNHLDFAFVSSWSEWETASCYKKEFDVSISTISNLS